MLLDLTHCNVPLPILLSLLHSLLFPHAVLLLRFVSHKLQQSIWWLPENFLISGIIGRILVFNTERYDRIVLTTYNTYVDCWKIQKGIVTSQNSFIPSLLAPIHERESLTFISIRYSYSSSLHLHLNSIHFRNIGVFANSVWMSECSYPRERIECPASNTICRGRTRSMQRKRNWNIMCDHCVLLICKRHSTSLLHLPLHLSPHLQFMHVFPLRVIVQRLNEFYVYKKSKQQRYHIFSSHLFVILFHSLSSLLKETNGFKMFMFRSNWNVELSLTGSYTIMSAHPSPSSPYSPLSLFSLISPSLLFRFSISTLKLTSFSSCGTITHTPSICFLLSLHRSILSSFLSSSPPSLLFFQLFEAWRADSF